MKVLLSIVILALFFISSRLLLAVERPGETFSPRAITSQEYCSFLNASQRQESEILDLYDEKMSECHTASILRLGSPGSYEYQPATLESSPTQEASLSFLSEQEAELFCDWYNISDQSQDKKWEIIESPRETHADVALHSNQQHFHLKSSGALQDPSTIVETMIEPEVVTTMELVVDLIVTGMLAREGVVSAHSRNSSVEQSPYHERHEPLLRDSRNEHCHIISQKSLQQNSRKEETSEAAPFSYLPFTSMNDLGNINAGRGYTPLVNTLGQEMKEDDLDPLERGERSIELVPTHPSPVRTWNQWLTTPFSKGASATEETPLLGASKNRTEARFYSVPIEQVASPRERAATALQTLKTENVIIKKALDILDRPSRSRDIMACLRCFTIFNTELTIPSLMTVNREGEVSQDSIFILNNGDSPFKFTIPSDDPTNSVETIISPIIPENIKSNISNVARSPARTPDNAENEQVRKYVYEAFEDHFDTEIAKHCCSDLMTGANRSQPFTIGKLQEVFEKLSDLYDNEKNPDHNVLKERAQKLGDLSTASINHNEEKPQQALASYDKAELILSRSAQEDLLKALWYSAETVVRGTGVILGRGAKSVGVVGAGGLTGGLTGFHTGGVNGAVGGLVGGLVGSLFGAQVGVDIRVGVGVGVGVGGFLGAEHGGILGSIGGGFLDVDGVFHVNVGGAYAGLLSGGVSGAVGGAVGTLLARAIGDRYFSGIAERADNYFNIAARRAGEAFSDFRNRSTFTPQALVLLNEAQQQDRELQGKLTTVFNTIPEETKKEFLSRLSTELAPDRAGLTESAATTEGAPVDQLPQNFEQVEHILHDQIEKRIDARDILIEYLKTKVPET